LFAAGTLLHYVFGIALFAVSVFLILLVLVQRGRGGGLTGALGGMGGQSAFGTKAGDVFTRVTMVTATVWILLGMSSIWVLGSPEDWGESEGGGETVLTPGSTGETESGSPSEPTGESAGAVGAETEQGGTLAQPASTDTPPKSAPAADTEGEDAPEDAAGP
jgi:preprotein translocase subunit SecG